MSLRTKVFQAMTGLRADVSGEETGDIKGMLLAVGGSSTHTKSGIDHAAAAKALGVSERTVRRWVHSSDSGAGPKPSGANAKKLASRARQAATTKAGRARMARGQGLADKFAGRGTTVTIGGRQGPRGDEGYRRNRSTTRVLYPEQAEEMLQAWIDGGDKGFIRWAEDHWDLDYVPNWQFEDVDSVSVGTGHN